MQDYSCEFLELVIRLPVEDFDKPAFLEDVKDTLRPDHSEEVHFWSYGSRDNPGRQHAHFVIEFRGQKNVRLTLTYHAIDANIEDVRPPVLEDLTTWLSRFTKVEQTEATARASFRFGKDYEPVIGLPFPLLVPVKELSGTKVTGVSLELPVTLGISDVIIQKAKEDTIIAASYKRLVAFRDFDLNKELDRTLASLKMLVKQTEDSK